MILPQTAEYALRAMAEMVLLGREVPVRTADLARKTGIPLAFLSKVMRRLVTRGLLESAMGPGGGFTIAGPLDEIFVSDILEAADYPFEESHCIFGWKRCNEKNPCPLHPSWKRVKGSFVTWAQETTLADIRNGR